MKPAMTKTQRATVANQFLAAAVELIEPSANTQANVRSGASFYPKGGMCVSCAHLARDCSHLDFAAMYPIKRNDDRTTAVRCSEFQRAAQHPSSAAAGRYGRLIRTLSRRSAATAC